MQKVNHTILADGRWQGLHGIGRFSEEVLKRLHHTDILTKGPPPLSLQNLLWQKLYLKKHQQSYHVFFTPGFNPVLSSSIPYVLTIHDLIHLSFGKMKWLKTLFYHTLIKPSVKKAYKIVTVSHYSKQQILKWANIPPEKVVVVGNGISHHFTHEGIRYMPSFPYFLHVGNTKEHKNVLRLIQAFALADLDNRIKLIFTHQLNEAMQKLIDHYHLKNRIEIHPNLSEETLATYYRGAIALLFPSLYEGFGLPIIEAMASGIPVLTSNITSMPEVAGDAALLVDPYSVDAISEGMTRLANDQAIRKSLINKGFLRATDFSWDKTSKQIQTVLDEL